jgi:putative sigma-54 modulation protein
MAGEKGAGAMQVAIRGKNVEVTPALRNYIRRKVGKLERFVDHPLSAQVTMEVERGRHIVEVTAALNGLLLRGEEASGDMYASIDLVADKLERQIMKYRTRFLRRRTEGRDEAAATVEREAAEETEGRIVKVKRFMLKPVTPEEAVVQMNLLGHDFFVFVSADTDQVNVVYRRKDGNYGLISPER